MVVRSEHAQDAIDKSALAGVHLSRRPQQGVETTACDDPVPRWLVNWRVIFLTSRRRRILVPCMRRALRVRVVFESTRCADEQLQLAYKQVVPTVRHACAPRRGDEPEHIDEQPRSVAKEATL